MAQPYRLGSNTQLAYRYIHHPWPHAVTCAAPRTSTGGKMCLDATYTVSMASANWPDSCAICVRHTDKATCAWKTGSQGQKEYPALMCALLHDVSAKHVCDTCTAHLIPYIPRPGPPPWSLDVFPIHRSSNVQAAAWHSLLTPLCMQRVTTRASLSLLPPS